MKYKVGDRVRIKSLDWYNQNRAIDVDYVLGKNDRRFARQMSKWCSQVATITKLTENVIRGPYYELDIDEGFYCWDDWMFEDNSEQKPLDLTKILKNAPEGLELYSTAEGVVRFSMVAVGVGLDYPIAVKNKDCSSCWYTKEGKLSKFNDAETILFPSKENRDWSTFRLPRWRAKEGNDYFCVSGLGDIDNYVDQFTGWDTGLWIAGNYFKTEEEAKNSKFYKVFHEEEG
jgi:hypothetical protein